MDDTAAAAPTRDAFFGGRLIINQPAKGHRAGTDAVLLAAAAPRDFAGLAFDAGAGVGTAGLGLALASPAAHVGLIESDSLAVSLARDNIAENGLEDRVDVHACDLLSAASRRAGGVAGGAALVISNPPFYQPGAVRASPDMRRRAAHVAGIGGTPAWVKACLALLGSHGTLILIHRPEALGLLLTALEGRAGAVTLMPIHTAPGLPAKRLLVRAVKGSRAPLTLRAGFALNGPGGFTAEAGRVNQGEALLDW